MPASARKLKLVEIRAKKTREEERYRRSQKFAIAEDRFITTRTRLKRHGYWPELRIAKMRAVIDDPFKASRIGEAIITHKYTGPIIVPLEQAQPLILRLIQHGRKAEYIYSELRILSRNYMKGRTEVRHLSWEKKKKRR